MEKKLVPLIILIIFSSFIITSCNISQKSLKGEFKIVADDTYFKYLKDRAVVFNERNPHVKIDVVNSKSFRENNNINELKKNITEFDKEENIDCLILKGSQIQGIANDATDFFEDLTKINNSNSWIYDWRKSETKLDGINYGFPLDTRPVVMYLNTDILSKYKIDYKNIITWNDFIIAGKEIKEKSKGKEYILNLSELTKDDFNMILVESANLFKYSDEEKIQKINDIKTLIQRFTNDGLVSFKKSDIKKSGTVLGSSKFYMDIQSDYKKINWDYYLPPAFEAGGNTFLSLEGDNFCILNKNKNYDALKEFLNFCTEDKIVSLDAMFKYGIFPCNNQCYTHTMIDSREELLGYKKLWQTFANIESNIKKDIDFEKILKTYELNF